MARNRRKAPVAQASEAEKRYKAAVSGFDKAVSDATRVSQAAAGRQAEPRSWWASVLFTRLCTTAVSLLSLAPRSRLAGRYIEHFDFSAVASLTRNLAECYLAFFYLCVDAVDQDEWLTRLNLLQLHDCTERFKMFRDFDSSDPQLDGF